MKRLIFRLMFGNSRVAEEAFALLQLRLKMISLEDNPRSDDNTSELCKVYDWYVATAAEILPLVNKELGEDDGGFWYELDEEAA